MERVDEVLLCGEKNAEQAETEERETKNGYDPVDSSANRHSSGSVVCVPMRVLLSGPAIPDERDGDECGVIYRCG